MASVKSSRKQATSLAGSVVPGVGSSSFKRFVVAVSLPGSVTSTAYNGTVPGAGLVASDQDVVDAAWEIPTQLEIEIPSPDAVVMIRHQQVAGTP